MTSFELTSVPASVALKSLLKEVVTNNLAVTKIIETRNTEVFYSCLSHFCNSVSTSRSSAKRLPRFLLQLQTTLSDKHFPP
jgi:hypothetical protein